MEYACWLTDALRFDSSMPTAGGLILSAAVRAVSIRIFEGWSAADFVGRVVTGVTRHCGRLRRFVPTRQAEPHGANEFRREVEVRLRKARERCFEIEQSPLVCQNENA